MRNWIALFALVCLLAPLSSHAASQPAATPLLSAPAAAAVVNLFLGAADAPTAAVATPQVSGFLEFLEAKGTGRQLGKVCSISCRECVATCPPGEGVCFRGGC